MIGVRELVRLASEVGCAQYHVRQSVTASGCHGVMVPEDAALDGYNILQHVREPISNTCTGGGRTSGTSAVRALGCKKCVKGLQIRRDDGGGSLLGEDASRQRGSWNSWTTLMRPPPALPHRLHMRSAYRATQETQTARNSSAVGAVDVAGLALWAEIDRLQVGSSVGMEDVPEENW